MKIFGYLDDILKVYYHLFDFLGSGTKQKLVAGFVLLILLWVLSKFIPKGR